MHLDVLDLRHFYYRTQLGRVVQRAIRHQLLDMWPEAKGQTVVGYGFAVPLLRPYLAEARRVMALMPSAQGVMAWPMGETNHALLVEEILWPLQTGLVDKLICMHGIENSDNPGALLNEIHRVLGPGGKALFVVPNRAGLWARRDATPFGFGQPYSLSQLETQVRRHGFVPERHLAALFSPPSHRRFWIKSSRFWEHTGRSISSYLAGGVVILEVSKQAYAAGGTILRKRERRLPTLPVLEPARQPGAKPA